MIIIWDKYGGLVASEVNETINQHSHGINRLEFAVEGFDANDCLGTCVFTLSDNSIIEELATLHKFVYKGVDYVGFIVGFDKNITALSGETRCVCKIKSGNKELYTYNFSFNINPTYTDLGDIPITKNEYNVWLDKLNTYLQRYDVHNIRRYDTLEELEKNKEFLEHSVAMVKNGSLNYTFYQLEGGTWNKISSQYYEDLLPLIPNELIVEDNKLHLAHDSLKIDNVAFKKINGQNILNSNDDLGLTLYVDIIGHNGRLTNVDLSYIQNAKYNVVFHDLDTDMLLYKYEKSGEYFRALRINNINSSIEVYEIKVDLLTGEWNLTTHTIFENIETFSQLDLTYNHPTTATNGSLTDSEFSALIQLANKKNFTVKLHSDIYELCDYLREPGVYSFSHFNYENNKMIFKVLTINANNKTFVINTKEL